METTEPQGLDAIADSIMVQQEEPQADEADVEESQEGPEDETEAEAEEPAEQDEGGDEPEDDEDAAEVEDHSETFRVKVDGEERDVTLDELKQSFSGQAYIQKGMKEAADARKEAQALADQTRQEREQLTQFVQQLQQGGIKQPPQPPSRELFDKDPLGFMEQKLAYEEAMQEYQEQQQQFQQLTQQQQEAQERQQREHLDQQKQLLSERIPDLADPERAPAIVRKMQTTAEQHYGLSPEDLKGVTDARAFHILHDAMKYRELQAGKAKATEKASKARPVVKSGARKADVDSRKAKNEKAKARMRKSGSVDDVANFLIS